MSTLKVDTLATRTGSGNITFSNNVDLTGRTVTGEVVQTANIASSAVTNAKIANSTLDLTAKVTGALPAANGGTALARAPHYCSVYLASNTGGIISVNSRTVCPMANTYIDNASGYNSTDYRYVIPSAGKYLVLGSLAMIHNSGSGQSNQFYYAIHVNGVEQTAPQIDSNGSYHWQTSGTVQLVKTFAANDYIDLRGQVSTGSGTTNYKFSGGACQMTVMELFGV